MMFSILVVDDQPSNFEVIEAFLTDAQYQLHYTPSAREAIAKLDIFQPDLILLDVMMPEMNGLEACEIIKTMPQGKSIPIIMATSLNSKQDLAKCLEVGADDFISKPLNRLELNARIKSMLRIRQQYQELSNLNNQLEAIVKDRTAELEQMLVQDSLTQLPSRNFLLQKLTQTLSTNQLSCAIIHLDCDQFKLVNGSFGYDIGNQLLIAIAKRLQEITSPHSCLCRMGEDEFGFLLDNLRDDDTLQSFISIILKSFDNPFVVADCEIFITASIGVSIRSFPHQSPEELLQDADTAMYQAKLQGKGSYQIFDQQMHHEMVKRLTLESDLQRALQKQEFTIYYQPIVELSNKKLTGFEALIRWQHPEKGLISPVKFIPSMETTGLVIPLGMFVFEKACEQLYKWQKLGAGNLTMSINLSVKQFNCQTLLTDIEQIIAKTKVNPVNLKLEITESALMDNPKIAMEIVEKFRSLQISVSIDDFGTGYSSLSYLHHFALDSLKIDRSFIQQIYVDKNQYHVVKTISTLAKELNLSVIAEGIETEQQLEYLQKLGCEFGQGYLFSKPLTVSEIEEKYFQ